MSLALPCPRAALPAVFAAFAACCVAAAGPASAAASEATAPGFPPILEWSPPSGDHAAQPALVLAADGSVHASWIERHGDRHRLRHARYRDDAFGAATTVASAPRGDWFVNWADFPRLGSSPDGALASFVLERSGAMPYAYDIRLLESRDSGSSWRDLGLLHDDGTESEHGFVAFWPEPDGGWGIAWLDGRNSPAAAGHGGHDGHASGEGAMNLRAARFSAAGKQTDTLLDERTCDCCQTDAALTQAGPVLVYRDRDAGEIRDIAIVRRVDGQWSAPAPVHADRWWMPACPVNGPAVAASGQVVVVAWYTAAEARPRVLLARSDDAGASFDVPVEVAAGDALQGRVDLALVAGETLVSWVEGDAAPVLKLARYDADLARQGTLDLAFPGPGRGSGFPQLLAANGRLHALWTEVAGGRPRLAGAMLDFAAAGSDVAPASAASDTPPPSR